MANAVVNRQVNVYINSGEAAKAYDVLIKREKLLNAELAKTTDPKRIKQLTAELDKLKDPIDRAAKKMKGELAPSIRELELATRKFLTEFKKTGDPETLRKFQQFQAELNKAKLQLNDLGAANKGLTSMGIFKSAFWANLAAGGIMAATSAISGFFTSSIDEALDADAATTRLKNTLENLGKSDAYDRISRKADEMANRFRYLDNDDVIGVFKKLIDYGKLTEKQMDDLLPVIIDFAANSQISLEESTSIIVKAIEGNGKALKEYGIDIKDAGTEAERLGVIMTTLKDKTEGAAEAFQNSAKGGIATARQELNNLKEDIGSFVIPIVNKLLSVVVNAAKGLKQFAIDIRNTFAGVRDQAKESAASDFAADENNKKFLEQLYGLKGISQNAKINGIANEVAFLNNELQQTGPSLKQASDKLKNFQDQVARGDSKLTKANKEYGNRLQAEEQELKNREQYLKRRVQLLNNELKVQSDTNTLGIPPVPDADKDKNKDKRNADLEKALEERRRLIEELNKIKFDQSLYDLSAFDKELKLIDQKYTQFRDRAQGEKEILIRIEDLYLTEKLQLIDTYVDREVNAWQRANEKIASDQDKQFMKNLKRLRDRSDELLSSSNNGSVRAQTELTLKNQQDDEDAIEAVRQQRIKEIEEYINFANQLTAVFSQIGQFKTEQENAELERDRKLNEKKIRNLDQRLKKGLISQQQFDLEVQKIEKDQEKREKEVAIKQFKRQQAADIGQALINGALAVTSTLAAKPGSLDILSLGAFRAIQIGLAVATTAAQVATIASRKPPQFAEGGMLGGRSHSAGGNAVIDGSGRKIAEVEAGEGIVNKRTMADGRRYSVSGTPNQIISRLNGMYGSSWEAGATLIPGWRSYSPQRMNYSAMKRMYADGGVMGSNTGNQSSDNAVFENLTAMISDMQSTQAYLASVLAAGIVADVSLNRFEQQQDRLTSIRRDATLK